MKVLFPLNVTTLSSMYRLPPYGAELSENILFPVKIIQDYNIVIAAPTIPCIPANLESWMWSVLL
jgi:hypothetical protein